MDGIEVTNRSPAVLVAESAFHLGWIGASIIHPDKPEKAGDRNQGRGTRNAATAPAWRRRNSHRSDHCWPPPIRRLVPPISNRFVRFAIPPIQGRKTVGPNLYQVVGGPHAPYGRFNYSPALKAKTGPWTFDELNEWLHKPSSYAPGTRMTFAGISNDKTRANVIAYLRSLSPNPVPLPPATPEPAATPAAALPLNRHQRLRLLLDRRQRLRPPAGSPPAPAPPDQPRRRRALTPAPAAAPPSLRPSTRTGNAARAEVIPDTDSLIAAACAAADVAGAVIRPFFRAGLATDLKADRSPVTIADRTAEQAMRAMLAERFPSHGILGEKFGLDRPACTVALEMLDPIDGTRAFSATVQRSAH